MITRGFYKTNPVLSWVSGDILYFHWQAFPPMAGLFWKFFLLFAGAGKGNYSLIVIRCFEYGSFIILLSKGDKDHVHGCK
jgi:hypothetical protein